MTGTSTVPGAGWTLIATSPATPVAGTGVVPVFSGLTFNIPAGTTYRFVMKNTGPGSTRYVSTPTPSLNNFTAGGVNLYTGTYPNAPGTTTLPFVGYSGSNTTLGTANRTWHGSITYIGSSACIAPPTPGTATATPSTPVCTGTTVQLNLSGNSTGTGQTYQWESSPNGSTGWTTVGGSQAFPGLTVNPSATTYYRCAVTCSGNTQYSTNNVQVTVLPGLAGGTYSINSAFATGGLNFNSFTDAVIALSCGITGPVVFNVFPGPAGGNYNEQIVIPIIGGVSETNTVTFNGNGITLYSGAQTTTTRHVIQLNGADYVTFNNLVIDASTGTFGWGIHFIGGADHNTISNCTINVDNVSTTTNSFAPIVFSNSTSTILTTGNNGSFNTIIGSTLLGGYYSIALEGLTTAGSESVNNKVINNTIRDSYSYAIHMQGQKNDTISGNDISRPIRDASTTTAGVFLTTGCSNNLIEKNRVHHMFDQITTSTSTCYGIHIGGDGTAATPNRVFNNLIYKINGNGALYGIYNTSGDYMLAYHNTIAHDYTQATAGTTYGMYQTSLATGIEYKNNIIYITRGGSGEKTGLNFVTTTSTIVSNNNDIYVNSAGTGANNIGAYGTTDYTTLATWQTANGGIYDAQSLNIDPAFFNPAAVNYKPTSFLLDNIGLPLGVTTDILNASRSATTPDPGAYEFTIPAIDIGVSVLASPNSSGCYSSSQSVVATVKNYGAASINFSSFPATVVCKISGTVTATLNGTLTGTLAPNATVNVTLTPTVNMSTNGSYVLKAYTVMASDGNLLNDTLSPVTAVVGVIGGTITSTHNSICVSATPTLTVTGAYGGPIQWQQSTFSASGPWANVGTGATAYTPSSPVNQTTHYRVVITCNANTATSNTFSITVNNPVLSGTTPGSRCGTGTVVLGATAPLGTTLNWYANSTGGAPIGMGSSFTTPVISSTTNFYVAASAGGFTANTGMPDHLSTAVNGAGVGNYGIVFDAIQPFTLNSVVVYPVSSAANTAGTITIDIIDAANVVLHTASFNVTGNPAASAVAHLVNLNFSVVPGTNLKLRFGAKSSNLTGLLFENSAAAPNGNYGYPFTIPGVLSINTSTLTAAPTNTARNDLYYYFYDWSVSTGCEGPRTPVSASVIPAPALNVTSGFPAVCSGGSTTISVSSSNDPNYTYSWTSNPAGFTATGTGPHTVSPTVTTTYIVSAIDNSGLANDGCTISESVTIATGPILAAGTLSASQINYCVSGTPVLTLAGSTGGAIQWQQSTVSASGPWTNIGTGSNTFTPSSPLTQTTYFQATTTCATTTVTSNVVTITVDNPQILSTSPDTRCGVGTVTLGATPASGTINWYADPSGGLPLATGTSFTTPVISSTTTYYAAATSGTTTTHFGLLNRVGSTTNSGFSDLGLMFDALQSFTLQSIALYPVATTPSGNASITIALKNSAGTILQSTVVSVPTTVSPGVKNTITLNFNVPTGTQHRLVVTSATGGGITGLIRESSTGYVFPYTLPGVASITSSYSSGATASFYYYFYDWVAVVGCEGTRLPVVATVTTPPSINATTNISTLCSGGSANLNVTSSNAGYSYIWNPGNLSGASHTVTPSSTTTYVVTATDNTAGPNAGCVNEASILINVQPASVTIAASPAEICQTGTSQISLTPSSGYAPSSIQWQSSSNNINFFDIVGENSSIYNTPSLTNTTVYYRAQIKNSLNVVCMQPSVTVSASTPLVTSSTGDTRCGAGLVTLQATGSGAGTLKWFNVPAGGNFIAGGNTYSPFVSASTTYYVEQSFGTTGGTAVVISELDLGTNDQLEITNVSGQTLDVTGWKVAISDSYTSITAVNSIVQVLSGTMAPGAMKTWTDLSSASNYWGSNMFWNPGAFPSFAGWAAILDNNNALVDIVFMNWPASNIAAASITIGTVTITGSSKWTGNGVNISSVPSTQSVSRQGSSDNNSAADFIIQNLSVGTINPGMTLPFTGFGCVSSRDAVPVVVNAAPAVSASATLTEVCPGAGTVLTASSSNSGYSYTWSPGNATGASVTVSPQLPTTYTVSAHDGTSGSFAGCDNTTTISITTKPKVFASALSSPNFVCSGDNSQLSSFASSTTAYAMSPETPFIVPVPVSGYSELDKNVSVALGDVDDGAWLINLPFAISFFGQQYDELYVGTNGFISFGSGYDSWVPHSLPGVANPNNAIYLAHTDWNFEVSGKVKYFTTGTAPHRLFVINYENVPPFSGVGNPLNGQIIVDEIAGRIYLTLLSTDATTKTLGIENATGTVSYSPPLRNNSAFTISSVETWIFDPAAIGGSFTYNWTPTTFLDDPTSATPVAVSVTSTTSYTVNITNNATGCSNLDTTTIYTGSPLSVASSVTPSTICSGTNSVLSASATGGCGPYTYSWDDGTNPVGTTATISVSPAVTTTYNYTVIDNAGNIEFGSLTVTVNPTPILTATPGLICGSGTATLTASSTVPGTTFTWSPSTNLNTTTGATVISSTTVTRVYTVTGVTAGSCSSFVFDTVTVSPAVTGASATATPSEVCLGGDVTFSASGTASIPGFTMNTSCSTGFIDISTTGTSVGTLGDDTEHNFTMGSFSFNGTVYTAARVGTNGVIALGSTAGEVSLTNATLPSTANSAGNVLLVPYWDDLDIQTGATIRTQQVGSIFIIQFSNMAHNSFTTGDITFQVQLNQSTGTVTYIYPDVEFGNATYDAGVNATVGIQWSSTSASLYSFNTASLTAGQCISFTPISLPLTYSWSGPNSFSSTQQNPTITGITAAGTGTYTVTLTSSDGCTGTDSASVIVGSALVVNVSSTANNFCEGGTTTLNSTVSGGGAPYTYSWSDGSTVVGTTASVTLTPPAGNNRYYLTVIDDCNSSVTDSVEVIVKPLPTVSVTKSDDICGTGSSTLTASGSGISYAWTPTTGLSPTTGPNVIASPIGTTTYTVTSTGSNGCTNTATILLNVYPLPSVSATATPPNICAGGSSQLNAEARYASGSIIFTEVTQFGGASVANGVTSPYPSFRNTSDDDFVEISNVSGAAVDVSGLIFELYSGTTPVLNRTYTIPSGTIIPPLSVLILHIGPGTDNVANRYLHTGGTDDPLGSGTSYGFLLKSGTSIVDAVATQGTGTYAWPVAAGVTAADWSGPGAPSLTSDAGSIRVAASDNNTGTDWATSDAALPQTIGTYNGGYISPPAPSFSFSWSPSTYLNSTTIANPLATGVASTITYAVTVTDATTSCFKTQTVSILIEPLATNATVSQATICAGFNDTLRATATGGALPYTFSWSVDASVIGSGDELIVNPTVTTTYTVTTSDGCGSSATDMVTINVNPLPVLVVTPPGGSICDGSPAGGISMTASGANTYAWSPAQGLNATTGATVIASASSAFATITYTVVGTNTTTNCVNSTSVTVYRNTYLTNVASASPSAICEDETSQLNSIFTVRTNPALLITEVSQSSTAANGQTSPRPSYIPTSDDDLVEISNLSSSPTTVGGMVFELWSSTLLNRSYTIPAGLILPGNGVLVLHIGPGTDNPSNFYYHTGGTDDPLGATTAYGFILKSGSAILDAIATTSSANVSYPWPAGSGVTSAQWSGTITYVATTAGVIRVGGYDNSTSADWVYSSNTNRQTLGTYNNFYADNSLPAFNYSWSPISFLSDPSISNPVLSNATPGNLSYTVTASVPGSGCSKSATANVVVYALPTAQISGTAEICVGASTNLNFSFTGAGPFTYSYSDGTTTFGPFTSSGTTATRTVTPGGSGNTAITYTLVSVSDIHCTGTVSGSAVITYDQVLPSLAGCPTSFSACNPVSWIPPVASDNCAGVVRTSNWTPGSTFPSGTTTVIYTATDGNSNSVTCSFNVTLLEPSSIGGITLTSNKPFNNICTGDNITISMNGVTASSLGAGATWKWYSGACGGTALPAFNGMTSISVSPSSTTTYFVRAEGTCNTTACLSLQAVVSTAPPSGNPGVAYYPSIAFQGATDSIVVNPVPGATFYYWTVTGNTNILFNGQPAPYSTSGPKVTLTFVTPATSGVGVGNYHIQFQAGNACGTTNNNNLRIRSTVDQPASVSGPLVACVGETKSYTVSPVVGAKTYQWSFQGGAGTITGNGTQTVNVTYTTLPAILCVHGVSSFGSAGPDLCLAISTITATPDTVTGNPAPCQGGTEVYTTPAVAGAASYTWTSSILTATVIGTGTSASITFPMGIFSGDVCVKANSGCGLSLPACMLVVNGVAAPAGDISGPSSGICGATDVNYQVPSTGAAFYTWSVPPGATIDTGQGTNSILVDFTSTFGGGDIIVVASNACGLTNDSFPVTGVPDPPVITGDTMVCATDVEQYTASSPGALSYTWDIDSLEGTILIQSGNGDQIILEWITNGGTVTAIASDSCGDSSPSSITVISSCRIAGSDRMAKDLNAMVFPNPTMGRFTLQFESVVESDYKMMITDMTGRVVRNEILKSISGMNQHEIDLSSTAKGVYKLTLQNTAGDAVVIRVMIQ